MSFAHLTRFHHLSEPDSRDPSIDKVYKALQINISQIFFLITKTQYNGSQENTAAEDTRPQR